MKPVKKVKLKKDAKAKKSAPASKYAGAKNIFDLMRGGVK